MLQMNRIQLQASTSARSRPVLHGPGSRVQPTTWQVRQLRLLATPTEPAPLEPAPTASSSTSSGEGLESESELKQKEADRLRAAEKFMVIGSGKATCKGCGFAYSPEKGDPEFPIPRGVVFQDLPADYNCPVCGANKDNFESKLKVVAGFAENQKYGLGTNSMTGDQKLLLIYGGLILFFILFLAGYALE